jgi:uncharacterized protein
MKFWDASAVVPLLVAEPRTRALQLIATDDPDLLVWWGTAIECASALARLEREETLETLAAVAAFERLRRLADGWHEVEPTDAVRETATRFLRVHPLRAAESLQLAAAFAAAEGRPSSLELLTLDDRLAAAARREGFPIVDVTDR